MLKYKSITFLLYAVLYSFLTIMYTASAIPVNDIPDRYCMQHKRNFLVIMVY